MTNGNGNDYLTQEEIDALLNQSNDSAPNEEQSLNVEEILTPIEQDALGEIGNITFGSAATALSTLLGKKVEITTPSISAIARAELGNEFPHPHVAVHVKYVEGFQGINLLVIKTHDAQVIADLMLGGTGMVESQELSEIHISAVQEAMNQMMGSAATSMSTVFNRLVNISPPGIDIMNIQQEQGTELIPEEDILISIRFQLKIENLIDSSIMQLVTVPFAQELVKGLFESTEEPESPSASTSDSVEPRAEDVTVEQEVIRAQEKATSEVAASLAAVPDSPQIERPDVNVQSAAFSDFTESSTIHSGDVNLDMLLDIPLKVTVELGRTKKLIKDILSFTQGSIIELDKLAGEPVDILVNDKLIAKGEVVVIDENFGVRVTDIVSKTDRIKHIQ